MSSSQYELHERTECAATMQGRQRVHEKGVYGHLGSGVRPDASPPPSPSQAYVAGTHSPVNHQVELSHPQEDVDVEGPRKGDAKEKWDEDEVIRRAKEKGYVAGSGTRAEDVLRMAECK